MRSHQSTSTNSNIAAITTQDTAGHSYLLVTNGSKSTYTVTANLSALIASGTGTMWQFDSSHMDVVVGNPTLSSGMVTFAIPGTAAVLLQF